MYPYSYYSSTVSRSFLSLGDWQFVVGIVLALVCAILLYVMVFTKKQEGQLPPFFRAVRDFFDVKYLLIEKIAKFIYVFLTLASVLTGFFLLFGETFLAGLLLMILGPVIHRLLYELFMLMILLVKNVMEINNHLKGVSSESIFDSALPVIGRHDAPAPVPGPEAAQPDAAQPKAAQSDAPQPEAPKPVIPQGRFCPKCGAKAEGRDMYCRSCGSKID